MPAETDDSLGEGGPRGWRRIGFLDLEVGLRAALAGTLPVLLLFGIDRLDLVAYAAFGGMTALYGRNEPYRFRLRTLLIAALSMLIALSLGTLLSAQEAPLWLVGIGLCVTLTVGILLAQVGGLFPATQVFQSFAFLVCVQVPVSEGSLGTRIGVGVISAVFAIGVSLSGWLIRAGVKRSGHEGMRPLVRVPTVRLGRISSPEVWQSIGQTAFVAVAAGGLAHALGMGHAYWAAVSAVAVTPPAGSPNSLKRAFHRVLGTSLGVLVSAVLFLPGPGPITLILIIMVCQFCAEVFIVRSYWIALIAVTPMALGIVQLVANAPVEGLLYDRVVVTALGAAVAVGCVLLVRSFVGMTRRLAHPRNAE